MIEPRARELPPGILSWTRTEGAQLLLDAIRTRARKGSRTESGTLRLAFTATQRRELAQLLGSPWDASRKPVRLQDLAEALEEHHLTVRGLIEALDGHIPDDRAERAAKNAAAATEREDTTRLLLEAGVQPDTIDEWLTDQGLPRLGTGKLKTLATQIRAVWPHLPGPAAPFIRLARLAAMTCRDAHALDYDTRLGKAMPRLIALQHGLPRPRRAGRDWRQAWAAAGVRCDSVSSRVLVLNLPLTGDAPAARLASAVTGDPVWLTLRNLDGDWHAPTGTEIFVCENPTVIEAAADKLGSSCPPIVCTDGTPRTAALDLLAGLATDGCQFRTRADIDSAGLGIVETILALAGTATLWRFDAAVYTKACDLPATTLADEPTQQFAELHMLYQRHRRVLHEEELLDGLLDDLGSRLRL